MTIEYPKRQPLDLKTLHPETLLVEATRLSEENSRLKKYRFNVKTAYRKLQTAYNILLGVTHRRRSELSMAVDAAYDMQLDYEVLRERLSSAKEIINQQQETIERIKQENRDLKRRMTTPETNDTPGKVAVG